MQTDKINSIEVLKKLIAHPTITPQECGIYAYIKEILSDFEVLEFDKEGVKNLFLYKDLSVGNVESQGAKTHLCFAGHIDVVPPGEGWASEPFIPTEREGFLYGRGAQDMKAGVAAFICAIREFVDCLELQNSQASFQSTNVESQKVQSSTELQKVSINETLDNEFAGADRILADCAPRPDKSNLTMTQKQDCCNSVNAESQSMQTQTAQNSSDSIQQGFNGILSVLLTSDEEGAAIFGTKYTLECLKERNLLPDFAIVAEPTSVEKFGDMIKVGRRGSINGILKIFGQQGHVAYPKKCLNPVDIIAPHLSRIAGHKLDNGSAEFEPSRLVVTDIRGGMEVVNVTPNDLKIMFNVRNSTQTSLESVREYLEHLLAKTPHSLELKQSSKPFLTDKNSLIVQKMAKVLELQNGFAPELSTSGGTSDARYFAEFGVKVVECGVCNDSIHSINERVKMSEVESLQSAFKTLLMHWGF